MLISKVGLPVISIAYALREFSGCAVEMENLGGDWWFLWVEKSELRALQGSESTAQERRLLHRKETPKIYRGPLEHSSEFCSQCTQMFLGNHLQGGKELPKKTRGSNAQCSHRTRNSVCPH